jgi:hypothetical protein
MGIFDDFHMSEEFVGVEDEIERKRAQIERKKARIEREEQERQAILAAQKLEPKPTTRKVRVTGLDQLVQDFGDWVRRNLKKNHVQLASGTLVDMSWHDPFHDSQIPPPQPRQETVTVRVGRKGRPSSLHNGLNLSAEEIRDLITDFVAEHNFEWDYPDNYKTYYKEVPIEPLRRVRWWKAL